MLDSSSLNIVDFERGDTCIIHKLFPSSWNFDFFSFIDNYYQKPYFRGYSLLYKNRVIGFGNILFFNPIGWLGNIIVKEEYRNQGLGQKITSHLLEAGKALGLQSFLLIATDLGIPVYKKLGFRQDRDYAFFSPGDSGIRKQEPNLAIEAIEKNDLDLVNQLDFKINGEERAPLWSQFKNQIFVIRDKNIVEGTYIKALGSGLVLAETERAGIELLKRKIIDYESQIVVPVENSTAISYLKTVGYEQTHTAPRMILGKPVSWKPYSVYSRGSGYLG